MTYNVYTESKNNYECTMNTDDKENAISEAYLLWVNRKDIKKYSRHHSEFILKSVWVEDAETEEVVWDSKDIEAQAYAEAIEIISNLKVTVVGDDIIVDDGFSVETHRSYKPDVSDITECLEMYIYCQAKVLRDEECTRILEAKAERCIN